MTILITGSTGFVGQALLKKLANLPLIATKLAAAADYLSNDPSIETLIHLAARVHIMNDSDPDPLNAFRQTNVNATLNLARQAAAAGVKRFIFISSIKVNGESTAANHPFQADDPCLPQDAYAISKHEAELGLREIAANTTLEVVIIRPPLIYGPGVKANFAALIKAIQRGLPLPLGAIQNQRSLVGIDNLVDFISLCISHPNAANQTFLVSDGQDLSTPALIRGIADAAGVKARLIPVPVWGLTLAGKLTGKSAAIERLSGNLQLDISKAQQLLGWTPPVSVTEGLRRAVQPN